MTIFRVEHQKNYTVINNFICFDKRLSWKAKGIWLYAFSRPDDWEFHMNDLINQSTDGKDSVTSGLKELEECGYLTRDQKRDNGKYSKAEWVFYEKPVELKKCLPKTDFPVAVNPSAGNPPLLSTERKLSTEKKQQQAAVFSEKINPKSKEPSEAFEVLDGLGLTHQDKVEISQRYSLEVVKKAVAWATHPQTKINKSLVQAIKWACKNPDNITIPKEKNEFTEENKKTAAKILSQAIIPQHVQVELLNKHAEIVYTTAQKSPDLIKYEEKGFKEKFIEMLKNARIIFDSPKNALAY